MKKTLIKFEKPNCAPCESVEQFLEQNDAIYQRINAFDNPDMARAYRIKTVPTVVLLEDGIEVKRSSGFNPHELAEILKHGGKQICQD